MLRLGEMSGSPEGKPLSQNYAAAPSEPRPGVAPSSLVSFPGNAV